MTNTPSLPTDFGGRILFIIDQYGESLLRGAGTTLLIALVGTLIGCIIGFVVGLIQSMPMPKKRSFKSVLLYILKKLLFVYVEVFRGTPMMVQSAFIYYGLAIMNINMSMWFAAFFIVSINTGAYMAETVRGGILSIDKGQIEGAKSIGMNYYQSMIYVILPQSLLNIMPQIGNNLIINIKDSSVLSVIGVVELFFQSKSVAGTYYIYFETYAVTMVMYLVMTLTCAFILRKLEDKLSGPENFDLQTTDTLAHTSGLARYRERNEEE